MPAAMITIGALVGVAPATAGRPAIGDERILPFAAAYCFVPRFALSENECVEPGSLCRPRRRERKPWAGSSRSMLCLAPLGQP